METARREDRIAAERAAAEQALRAAETDRQRLEAEMRAAELARRQAEAEKERAEEAAQRLAVGAPTLQTQNVPASPITQQANVPSGMVQSPAASGAAVDGIYGGQLCFGPSRRDGARCFRTQATLEQGKIAGRVSGREPGVTLTFDGDVSEGGGVTMEIRIDNGDGSRRATINITGTLQDGRIDAAGRFTTGRSASLDWRRN